MPTRLPLEADTLTLSLPRGRRVGQPGHRVALEFLEKRMGQLGIGFFKGDSFRFPYNFDGVEFTNLAGIIPGSEPGLLPVLLGAHYDSAVDGPCTDDNAVSAAVILAVCERLVKKKSARTVIVVFFDAEERPFFGTEKMGSVRFCEDHCGIIDFASVIILDAIGHDFETLVPFVDKAFHGLRQFLFILGSESHSLLPAIVEQASASIRGVRIVPTLNRYIGDSSDYLAFRKAGQPFLFLSRGRGKHTHTMNDEPGWINFFTVEKVLSFLLRILELLDSTPMEQERHGIDPFDYEIRMMKKAVGPLLPVVLRLLGMGKTALGSREDLDRLSDLLGRIARL